MIYMNKYKAKEVMRAQVSCAGTQADQPPGAGRLQEESPAKASIPLGHWTQIQVQVHMGHRVQDKYVNGLCAPVCVLCNRGLRLDKK
jgi:hypothetical protein